METVKQRRYSISHLSAIHRCIDHLGVDVDPAWLFGASGYAFMINIPRGVSCAGPTAWNWQTIQERTPNIGIDTSDYILSFKDRVDFDEKKKAAIDFTKNACQAGTPLYGCEFGYPEFYTVTGVDDVGFTFYTLENNGTFVHRTWDDFGLFDVGILFAGSVTKIDSPLDDLKTISDALQFALLVRNSPASALGAQSIGLNAYDTWIESLKDGSLADGPWCHPDGTSHNAACWCECRDYAVQFLKICAGKVSPSLRSKFFRAVEQYTAVHQALEQVKVLFPYSQSASMPSHETVTSAVAQLRKAKDAEHKGLVIIEHICKELSNTF